MEGIMGVWRRDPAARAQAKQERQAAFEAVIRDPVRALEEFDVRHVALGMNHPIPERLAVGWKLTEPGPHWRVWDRERSAGDGLAAEDRNAPGPERNGEP